MNTQQGSILGAFAVTMLAMAAHDKWVEQFIGWVQKAPGGAAPQSSGTQIPASAGANLPIENPAIQGLGPNG